MSKFIGRLAIVLAALALAPAAVCAQMVTALDPPASAGQLAALQAQIPLPSDAPPDPDMATGGAVGSSPRYRRPDDQAPRLSRVVKSAVAGTDGTVAVSWPAMPSVPGLQLTPYAALGTANPARCYPVAGTVTASGATIRCVRPTSVLSLGILPADVSAPGTVFDVLALPGS